MPRIWIRVALLDARPTTWQLNCVTLGEQPAQRESRSGSRQRREPSTQPNAAAEIRGIGVETLDLDTARRLGLRAGTQGAVVVNVEPGSVGDQAGLQEGDVILEVNRQSIRTAAEYDAAMRKAGSSAAVLFVNSKGRTHYVTLRPESSTR